ncbi:hypothetical protein FGG08_000840 [Glutinoglossum americanum]|uniref:SET domain-containing protein n=1 Tax=Glutinoglossum americanum TaxID=1670608 RepID=A0A9P8L5U4_9PEZI|nr:hypothetical protein FGG08_000840 [Glutinoglossum americanum]
MSASDVCRAHIAPSPTYGGVGLFASTPIQPGSLILSLEEPLLAIPDVAYLEQTCSGCFCWVPDSGAAEYNVQQWLTSGHSAEPKSLKTCTGCKVVRYCDKHSSAGALKPARQGIEVNGRRLTRSHPKQRCQALAWDNHHKYECKLFAHLHPKILPTPVRGTLRLLLLRQKDRLTDEQWSALLKLLSHSEDFRNAGGEKWEGICLMSKGAHAYSKTDCGEDFVRELFCRIIINSLTLATSTFDSLGICLDPLVASINHSCDPNAVVTFDGSRLCLRSTSGIEKGGEIYISYIDSSHPTVRRQSELQSRYFFACTCTKCQQTGPRRGDSLFCPQCGMESVMGQTCLDCGASGLTDYSSIENLLFDMLDRGKKALDPENVIKPLRNSLAILRETQVWPVTRQPLPSILHSLAIQFLALQQWAQSLGYMLKIYFDIDPLLFPQPWHPERVMHHLRLTMLVLHLADLSGNNHPSVKELEQYGLEYGVIIWGLLYEMNGNVDKSHGKESRFARTVKSKFEELRVDMARGGNELHRTVSQSALDTEWAKMRKIAASS